MVTTKHRLGFITAATLAIAFSGWTPGHAQTAAAPTTAAPPATSMPQAQPSAPPVSAAAHSMKSQVHRHAIESVQTALNASGAKLTVDGRLGPKTAAALRAFQRQHNLKVTGLPDRATRTALGVQH